MITWVEKNPPAGSRPISERPDSLGALVAVDDDAAVIRLSCLQGCIDAIYEHTRDAVIERGGLLLGFPWHSVEPPATACFVDVVDAVPADISDGTAVSLAMGAALWQAARERTLAAGDGRIVVGWYHSHPDLGAFFSATDRRTQAGFFREDWHLGLCIDPVRRELAWFSGSASQPVPSRLAAGTCRW